MALPRNRRQPFAACHRAGSTCHAAAGDRNQTRVVSKWVRGIGLDPSKFATHSLRRTKATLIYRRTGNLRAVQLLLGIQRLKVPCGILVSRSTMPLRSLEKVEA